MPKLTDEENREDIAYNLKSILISPHSTRPEKMLAENQLRMMQMFHVMEQRIERLESK